MEDFDTVLIQKALFYFDSVYVSESTDDERRYYRDYFEDYPEKGTYEEFYDRALRRHVKITYTDWAYEVPVCIYTNKELDDLITRHENLIINEWKDTYTIHDMIETNLLSPLYLIKGGE